MGIFNVKSGDDNEWGPIADLMSGLMIVFLFISVIYMLNVSNEKKRIQDIAVTYNELQTELYNDLNRSFENDLEKWGAVIDEQTLSVRFEAPEILFGAGSSEIRSSFQKILDDFFPRYIEILYGEKYRDNIEEIRIEGHTSSEWLKKTTEIQAYFNNMELSQNRTRAVLEYVLSNTNMSNDKKDWVKKITTANGLSSSKLIFEDETEHKERSRRVEFRVRTNAETQIVKILNAGK
jgi:outer membrane protein OmpA-like peptidoglycan-associated protein